MAAGGSGRGAVFPVCLAAASTVSARSDIASSALHLRQKPPWQKSGGITSGKASGADRCRSRN